MAQMTGSDDMTMNDLDLGEYQTSIQTEVTTFAWRLQDFSRLMEMFGDRGLSIQFSAGQSLGLPSTWKLEIVPGKTFFDVECQRMDTIEDEFFNGNRYTDNTQPRSLRLSLVPSVGEGVQPKYAKCEVTIKDKDDPTKNWKSFTLLCKDTDMKRQDNIGSLNSLKDKALIRDDLVIRVKFTLAADKVTVPAGENATEWMETSRKGALNSFEAMLESGYGSDFVIKVKNKDDGEMVEMKAHKAILGSRSPVFQRMLDSEMRERGSGEMVITDLSPATVKILLKWMYTGSLDDGWKTVPEEMVNAANKYQLRLLLQFLNRNLHTICEMDNALKLGTLAKLHGLAFATKKIAEFVKANVEVFFQG